MRKCKVFTLSLCRETDGQTGGQTDGQTDGRTDNGKTIFRYEGIKINRLSYFSRTGLPNIRLFFNKLRTLQIYVRNMVS